MLLDIYKSLLNNNSINSEFSNFFSDVNEYFKKEDIYKLLDLCIKYKLCSFVDKINNYFKSEDYISEKYKVDVPKKMSGKKIINLIYNTKQSIKIE